MAGAGIDSGEDFAGATRIYLFIQPGFDQKSVPICF
jgi:hypothetical protein